MKLVSRQTLRSIFCTAVLLVGVSSAAAQAPEVVKVEPPNWWAGHSINPVRVLIRGKNFAGARVESSSAGLRASNTKINASGTYIFVDVLIDPRARSGLHALKIITTKGTVSAPFEISVPLDRAGRFQGFTTDDVIYLIMTDRFSDGDPSNDDPPEARGMY